MKTFLCGLALPALLAALLSAPLARPAAAASNTTVGVGSGAVAGALVGGPIGAVAGAIVGGVVGASTERPRRYRRVRARRSALPVRPVAQRVAPAAPRGALTPTVSAEPAPVSTGSTGRRWTDPR
ncbi:hypothetical protein [Methylobacterium gregans]|uniref:Glycine zipper domain-containing protein n=1 Tax=Methylobacterium gregans TaxID=374424 RepID=A0AA37HR56_9HYPH|nr:hypothetical protein [Methylobacterium gregans]MDQ0522508.1 surface antigen [Methylobacterium gregans]GJD80290.1 hypothetical protein NBEOAGPD_3531 [Methylobacterium gregans]GLS55256.1 hypothetical protein GCM10007886_34400 [Methylobacterium gregans]